MATPSDPGRNLLFGVLALQLTFITREALIAATSSWVLDKTRSLGDILIEQQALAPETRALLESLVSKHLEIHGGGPEKSLAWIRPVVGLHQDLHQIAYTPFKTAWLSSGPLVRTRTATKPRMRHGLGPMTRQMALRARSDSGSFGPMPEAASARSRSPSTPN
jgi:hypothetical protein